MFESDGGVFSVSGLMWGFFRAWDRLVFREDRSGKKTSNKEEEIVPKKLLTSLCKFNISALPHDLRRREIWIVYQKYYLKHSTIIKITSLISQNKWK